MILLIDNYDSFVYNLYQLIGTIDADVAVVRNDAVTVADIRALAPEAVVLSPGPGRPADAGICEQAVHELAGDVPILGVCLGHQAIVEAFGGRVGYAKTLMHGKTSPLVTEGESALFAGLGQPLLVGRYHSLAADEATLPACLAVTARTPDGEVMAVEHRDLPVFGMQFHPESILTPTGPAMLENFLDAARRWRPARTVAAPAQADAATLAEAPPSASPPRGPASSPALA
ncbi:aminodeoxychorismate/anthranilate synthase component II [Eggerthellaceae bacterium zg-893]|nr:aminodeoxychorismate/anthranilate synthase component II [Eggerthellaceae bacterium zg-893]